MGQQRRCQSIWQRSRKPLKKRGRAFAKTALAFHSGRNKVYSISPMVDGSRSNLGLVVIILSVCDFLTHRIIIVGKLECHAGMQHSRRDNRGWQPAGDLVYTDGNNCHSDKSSILSLSIRYAAQFSLASLRSVLVRLGEFWCPPLIVPMIFYRGRGGGMAMPAESPPRPTKNIVPSGCMYVVCMLYVCPEIIQSRS